MKKKQWKKLPNDKRAREGIFLFKLLSDKREDF